MSRSVCSFRSRAIDRFHRSAISGACRPLLECTTVAAAEILGRDDHFLYARVDCVDLDGSPRLMELELIEPDLYVGYDVDAADRVVRAVRSRLDD